MRWLSEQMGITPDTQPGVPGGDKRQAPQCRASMRLDKSAGPHAASPSPQVHSAAVAGNPAEPWPCAHGTVKEVGRGPYWATVSGPLHLATKPWNPFQPMPPALVLALCHVPWERCSPQAGSQMESPGTLERPVSNNQNLQRCGSVGTSNSTM